MSELGVGIDRVLTSLSAIGAGSLLTLPGVDEPVTATTYVYRALALMRERDVPFERAWSSAINRIQAPQGPGGVPDGEAARIVAEERASLEEDRSYWQAAYEGRAETTRERAVRAVAGWRRLDRLEGIGAPPANRAA